MARDIQEIRISDFLNNYIFFYYMYCFFEKTVL